MTLPAPSPTSPVPRSDIDALLLRIARGDAAAFEVFYDTTAASVFGVAVRVLRDRHLAEDVAQEVFVEAWSKAPSFDPTRGTATTWLLTMAHRRAIDRVRSVQSSRDRDERQAVRTIERCSDVVWGDVETGLDRQEVRHAFRRLSRLQREAIHLTYYQGLTYREAAEQLGRPLGTVKSRIRDGLRGLGEELRVTDRPAV